MKTRHLVTILFAGIFSVVAAGELNQLVAKDSNGIVIEIKEKYGGTIIDTATAVIYHEGNFVVIHREGVAAWYPSSFHSVRVLERLDEFGAYAAKRWNGSKRLAQGKYIENQKVN